MGGSLFSDRRVSKEEYDLLFSEVAGKLRAEGLNRALRVPRSFRDKLDFGDLDICLVGPTMISELLIGRVFSQDISINDCVLSFGYKGFQIDLCHFPEEDLESAVNYMSFGDLSNMIGVIANYAMGLRYTHKGLVCPVKLKQEQPLGEILVSKDVRKIMSFMDLAYEKWEAGFSNELEAFEWICKSQYFNADFFKFENLNHQNRTRNRKRAMYSRFVDWCEGGEFENKHETTKNKTEHVWRAALHFGFDWIKQAEPLIGEHRRDKEIRSIFNGNDISKITGLTGLELGDTLQRYKDSLGDWKAFFHARTKEEMIEHFRNWYKNTNGTPTFASLFELDALFKSERVRKPRKFSH